MKHDLGSSIVFEILLNISLKWILGHSRLHIQQMDKKTNCPNDISTHILRCLNPIRYLSRLNGTVSTKVINGSQQVPAGKWSWKIFLLNGNYNGNYIADQWELYIADDDMITLICVDISTGTIYVYIYSWCWSSCSSKNPRPNMAQPSLRHDDLHTFKDAQRMNLFL